MVISNNNITIENGNTQCQGPTEGIIIESGAHYDPACKQILEVLQISEEKYRMLFNNIDDSIFLVDITEDGLPGKILEANDTACSELGYSREEILSMTMEEIKTQESFKETPYKIKSLIDIKHSKFKTKFIRKDGSIFHVECNANLIINNGRNAVLTVCRNIEDRIVAETLIKESELRYKTLIDSSPDAVYVHQDDVFVFCNDKGARILGYDNPNEVIGRTIWNFTPQNEIIKVKKAINIVLGRNKNLPLREQKLIRKDGSIIYTEISSTPIPFNNNICILNIMRDITERKQMEVNLRETLEENEKLLEKTKDYDRLKTEFFSNISHELKTPLNIILGTIQLIKDSHKDNPGCPSYNKSIKYINMMKQNCFRLLRLINNLIDITRIDAQFLQMDIKKHNIVKIVEDITLSVLDYVESKGITLVFDTEVEEKIVSCDDDKIERMMLNLLSNAIKFTEPGGRIEVNIFDKEDKINISVKDSGSGIPQDKLNSIFERFKQGSSLKIRKREGSGIGLSLVKALADAHKGNIMVKSQLGVGSEFIIELPSQSGEEGFMVYEEVATAYDNSKVERISIEFSDIYSS